MKGKIRIGDCAVFSAWTRPVQEADNNDEPGNFDCGHNGLHRRQRRAGFLQPVHFTCCSSVMLLIRSTNLPLLFQQPRGLQHVRHHVRWRYPSGSGQSHGRDSPKFGNLELYDPRRAPLLEELSGLMQLRTWLRSEPNRLVTQPMNELARALATLKVGCRRRVQIIAEIISRSPAMKEH